MEVQGPNQKPELSPGPETELSGPLNTLVDQNTPLTKDEEFHFDTSSVQEISDFSEFWDCPEEETNDRAHPASAQSYFTLSDRNVEEVLQAQQANHTAFLEEYRNISSQHISRVEQVMRTEHETGMERFVNYVKSLIPQPAQASAAPTITELRAQLKKETNYTQKLSADYNNLLQHSHKQKQDLGKVNAKLDDALRERDQLRQLLGGGSLANSDKTTDDSIRDKWKVLAYNIRCLARHLAHNPPQQQLDEVAKERLRFVARNYHTLLEDEDYRELILMSYLWATVQDDVFDARQTVWGGPELQSFKAVRDRIISRVGDGISIPNCDDPIAHTARWLAQGSVMMSNLWERDDRGMRRLVLAEAKRLRPFHSTPQSTADRCDKKVTDQLRDILGTAIELDQMMMGSKAIFLTHWRDQSQNHSPAEMWNEGAMDSEACTNALSPKSRVIFFISPILRKVGTADGQRYNSNMVLAKGLVVCD
ncbi:hypothetical protein BFJ72_g9800 [Fusarium proliferatum]|uniref:Uncharacterized protein n=1 Tax=Gibberella intermedia TaxID=948311 RepID=A0A420SWA1_GIBIN|nr:hypothetical protein BFJ72_g9800 [Fusarium proliferatum]